MHRGRCGSPVSPSGRFPIAHHRSLPSMSKLAMQPPKLSLLWYQYDGFSTTHHCDNTGAFVK
ncbi:hypothetical protein SCLCIDRAFT_546882 [Scleroderma citrinum Foug A]|uniref:Uncharacterized protein n=1 Tax=Scleroderma citrinum Foug A TaxID=1036808 RepID=A0A0C3D8C9_9AGAM|nr:hypothetical protein SCLCIDRAFT_546882 [Scleroderma citrinum Foug A]